MSYLDVNKFSFDNEELRGFILSDIDELKINITDIKVVFQKNRAIVFNIVIDDVKTIKYLNKESVKNTYLYASSLVVTCTTKITSLSSYFLYITLYERSFKRYKISFCP